MMMSGSWRRNARSATANVSPAFSFMLTWLIPASWISAGSSAVEMLTPGWFRMLRHVYSDTVLPLPVGPVTRIIPYGRPIACSSACLLVGLVAQRLDAELDARGVEDTHHDLLAEERRQRAHAEVDRLGLRQHDLHAAVLRHALLGDVELRDHLDPRRELVLDHERRLRDLHQDAVEPVADAVELLVRLEVDVRDAGRDRVDQDLLEVADDRRVLDLGAFLVVAALRRCRPPGGRPPGPPWWPTSLSSAPEASTSLWIAGGELVVLDDDRLDDEIRLEPDLLEALQVRRIGRGDVEPVAALVQRQNVPRLGNLEVDQVLLDLVDVEPGEVEERDAERARREDRQLARRNPLAGEHVVDEADARLLRLASAAFRPRTRSSGRAARARARGR